MGQKINPISLRMGTTKTWGSRWFFPSKSGTSAVKYPYARFLEEDEVIRNAIRKRIGLAGIAGVEIERTSNNLRILIKAARPGLVIGQGGKGIEDLTKLIEKNLKAVARESDRGKQPMHVSVTVEELKRSQVSSPYIAQQIAWDLEKRQPFRWTMKKYVEQMMQNKEVKGVKVHLSGRLGGAEIARRESLKKGSLPLQTIRADVDYGTATAFTTYGTIGIKVWVYKGEVFADAQNKK